MSRIFQMSFSKVYPLYLTKIERKGRTQAELDQVILWLTGMNKADLKRHLKAETTFEDFFGLAKIPPQADQITGSICGVKVQEIQDPLMKQIRMLDKLVDELAKGRPLEKVLRNHP